MVMPAGLPWGSSPFREVKINEAAAQETATRMEEVAGVVRGHLQRAIAQRDEFESRRDGLLGEIDGKHREFESLATTVASGDAKARKLASQLRNEISELTLELDCATLALTNAIYRVAFTTTLSATVTETADMAARHRRAGRDEAADQCETNAQNAAQRCEAVAPITLKAEAPAAERRRHGIRFSDVARRSNLSVDRVARIESDPSGATLDELSAIRSSINSLAAQKDQS